MHDRLTLAKLNARAIESAKIRRREAVLLARSKAFDLWPGDTPDFDGSVRYGDATPEYAGSRALPPAKRILCIGYGVDGVIEIRQS